MVCIDQQRIRDAALDDEEFMVELIDLFLHDMPAQMDWLRAGTGKCDRDEVKKAAHRIRGAAANMGALRLSELCADLEKAVREEEPQPLGDLLQVIEEEWERVHAALGNLKAATASGR